MTELRQSLIVVMHIGAFLLLVLVLTFLPLRFAALLVGGGLVVALTLVHPVWALYAAVLSVPIQELVHLPGGLSVTQATFLLAGGTWGLRILAYPEQRVRFGRLAVGLAVLLWALLLATVATPYSQSEGLKETLRWFTVAVIYLLALNTLTSDREGAAGWQARARILLICLLCAPTANALLGLWQFAMGSGPTSFAIAESAFARAYGTIGQPNSFAGYINMAWPLAVALALGAWKEIWVRRREWHTQLLLWAGGTTFAAGVLIAALGSSFSRGGWVGAMGGGVVLIAALVTVQRQPVRRYAWRWAVLAGVSGGLVTILIGSSGWLPAAATERVESIARNLRLFDVRTVDVTGENFAVVERMAHLQAGWNMLTTHPLTGVGPGNFSLAYEGRSAPQTQPFGVHPWYTSRGHAHNYYLHMAAEAGLSGILAYLLLLGLLIIQGYRTLRRAEGWFWQSVAVGGCGIIAAVATHNVFENLHVLNMGIQLGAIWGLLTAIEENSHAR